MLSATGWWLAQAPVDLRCGIDRLLVQVHSTLGRDAADGGAYVFRNRAGNRIKVLCVDAHGVWLCVRRLHQGPYLVDVLQRVGQHPASRVAELTPRQWKLRFADTPLRSDLLSIAV